MQDKMLALKQEIDNYEIVSFDIFDTLLLRDIYKPTDIFRILGNEVKEKYRIENFFQMRINAETEARKKVENQEANYDEIYIEIKNYLPEYVEEIKQRELELELEFIRPNPFMKEIYQYAVKNGKNVLFISDMYLGKKFIGKLLDRAGYKNGEIYVSNEYRKNKGEMGLYEEARKEQNLKKERWLHIGDNEFSDYKKAREYGIQAYLYPNVVSQDKYKPPQTIGESIIRGIQNNILYNGTSLKYWEKYGIEYASPIYFGFARWLYQLTKTEDNLYFLARDGYVIKKIYNMFCELEHNPIYTSYLYCSRRVLQLPAMAESPVMDRVIKELTVRMPIQGDHIKLKEILQNAQVTDWEKAEREARAAGFPDLDADVSQGKQYLAQKIVARLGENIRNNLLSEKQNCLKYLEQEKIFKWKHLNVMDVGWRGSCQRAIEQMTKIPTQGYYFGTVQDNDNYCNMYGWYFDCDIPTSNKEVVMSYVSMYEMLFSAPHGSVVRYQSKDAEIVPILDEKERFNEVIEYFQEAAVKMCSIYIKYDKYIDWISPEFCAQNFKSFLERKAQEDVREFSGIKDDFIIGNKKKYPFVAEFSKADIEEADLKELRRRKNSCFWHGAYLIQDQNMSLNEKSMFQYKLEYHGYEDVVKYEYPKFDLSYAKVYFDFERGFNEEDAVIVKLKSYDDALSFKLEYPFNAKSVRIDPIEYHFVEIGRVIIKINGKKYTPIIPKSARIVHNGYRKIRTQDPSIIVEGISEQISSIEFCAQIKMID